MNACRSLIIVLALAGLSPASAQFVVDHRPHPFGGSGSDTAVPQSQLPFTWQESADDFRVTTPATVTHVNWWGFHFENVAPPTETMRVRFFRARASDGLPGDLRYEETFENPERIDTGRTILIGGLPREYRYHVALAKPIELDLGAYWFEVVQVGDSNSGFRFEFSLGDVNSFAFRNNLFPEWRLTTQIPDLAFQLVIPEPMTASMLLLGLAFAAGLRARGRINSG